MTFYYLILAIKATSAGKSDGNMCNIQLNNGENICLQQRGYNVVAFDPYTGQLLSRSFDTHNKGEVIIKYLIKVLYDNNGFLVKVYFLMIKPTNLHLW